ncbi:hypothetical protein [Cupriavidus metallidurans]|uniref:hypothetical protein n=1 Tax=Cupriavidus metallidurans TaxID=119219 RepID=UPI0035C75C83
MQKLLTGLLAAILSTLAPAQTKTPVQLLNPSGSAAGQAVVSTGPNTPPAWGNVTATALGPQPANTAVANVTGSSAAPTAAALPSCSTGNSALKYTSGTGFSCGTTFALTTGNLSQFASTTSAQLLGILSDETGSGAAVFGTSPTLGTPTLTSPVITGGSINNTPIGQTTPAAGSFTNVAATGFINPSQTLGLIGTTTNNNANAGAWGEYVEVSPAAVGLTTATSTNIASQSLTAGDYDAYCNVFFLTGAGDTATSVIVGLNTTSATLPAVPLYNHSGNVNIPAGTGVTRDSTLRRFSLASTSTVYCIANATHSGGTMTGQGILRVRRIR